MTIDQDSAEAQAAAALEQFEPLSVDAPGMAEFEQWARTTAADGATARALRGTEIVTEATLDLVGGGMIAGPGDVLIVTAPAGLTAMDADRMRRDVMERLPGVRDVVVLAGATSVTAYRPEDDQP